MAGGDGNRSDAVCLQTSAKHANGRSGTNTAFIVKSGGRPVTEPGASMQISSVQKTCLFVCSLIKNSSEKICLFEG